MDWKCSVPFHRECRTLPFPVVSSPDFPYNLQQAIYIAVAIIFWDDLILPQGWMAGQWIWGTTAYIATLVTVLLKAALISE